MNSREIPRPGSGPKFRAGDTITDYNTYLHTNVYMTIARVTRGGAYQFTTGEFMPSVIVDRLWTLASNEGEIVDD